MDMSGLVAVGMGLMMGGMAWGVAGRLERRWRREDGPDSRERKSPPGG